MYHFYCCRTSLRNDGDTTTRPCDDAVWDDEHKCWMMNFLNMDELLTFVKKNGSCVIAYRIQYRGMYIEIYDDWRE